VLGGTEVDRLGRARSAGLGHVRCGRGHRERLPSARLTRGGRTHTTRRTVGHRDGRRTQPCVEDRRSPLAILARLPFPADCGPHQAGPTRPARRGVHARSLPRTANHLRPPTETSRPPGRAAPPARATADGHAQADEIGQHSGTTQGWHPARDRPDQGHDAHEGRGDQQRDQQPAAPGDRGTAGTVRDARPGCRWGRAGVATRTGSTPHGRCTARRGSGRGAGGPRGTWRHDDVLLVASRCVATGQRVHGMREPVHRSRLRHPVMVTQPHRDENGGPHRDDGRIDDPAAHEARRYGGESLIGGIGSACRRRDPREDRVRPSEILVKARGHRGVNRA